MKLIVKKYQIFRNFLVEEVMKICEKQLFNPHLEGVQDKS
jgi:hypothetical protein